MATSNSPVVSSSTESAAPDYSTVEIPTTKPPEEFTYQERRADLLQQIQDLGHPSMINQVEAADRYGVSQQQISKDLDRIAESVRAHLTDRSRRAFSVDTVVKRAIRGLLEEEEYRKAARTAMEWDDWVTEFADIERIEREIEQIKANQ